MTLAPVTTRSAGRVLFLAARLGPGGVTTHMATLASLLQRHGWGVAVASAGGAASHDHGVEWLGRQGIRHYDLRFPQRARDIVRVPATARRLLSIVADYKPDVVHVHWRSSAWGAEVLRLLKGIPFVVTVHVEGIPSNWTRRLLSRWGDQVIAVSSDTRNDIARRFDIDDRRIRVIPYGVDDNHFRPPSEAERLEQRLRFGISAQATVVSLLGSGWRRKGHDVLIRALARLRDRGTSVVALLAGDEQDREFVATFSEEHGVTDCVRFLGYQESRSVLWASDIFALPSRVEGLPIAVIEAMLCGVVPVRTPAGGAADQIIDGVTGLLFPFERSQVLADHLDRLARDMETRSKMQRAALEHARARFTSRRMGEEVLEVYGRLLAGRRARWSRADAEVAR